MLHKAALVVVFIDGCGADLQTKADFSRVFHVSQDPGAVLGKRPELRGRWKWFGEPSVPGLEIRPLGGLRAEISGICRGGGWGFCFKRRATSQRPEGDCHKECTGHNQPQ
jgi:hypothetical protein